MKNWHIISRREISVRSLLLLAAAFLMLSVGCDSARQTADTASDSQTAETADRKIPKLSLHRPDNCDEAVSRMKKLVDTIASEGPLPQPLKYKVREVIHGSGASAHSHYYRIDENGKQIDEEDNDGHEHMESSEKQHEIEVEPYTELLDIAQWLPHIAADADIDESTWNEVKATSKEMADVLRLVNGESSEEKKRELFRSKIDSLEGWIEKLESSLNIESSNPDSRKAE
jgi:hypothetical protein